MTEPEYFSSEEIGIVQGEDRLGREAWVARILGLDPILKYRRILLGKLSPLEGPPRRGGRYTVDAREELEKLPDGSIVEIYEWSRHPKRQFYVKFMGVWMRISRAKVRKHFSSH